MFGAPLQAGQTFARQYTVVSPLSEGGMGAVYVVEHQGTGKQRALKVMHAHVASNPRFVQRFVQEARVGSRVESKHIVDVLDAGVDESTGIPFLVMELLRGETLARRLERAGTLTPSELLEVFRQLAHGLGRVHAVGVVHRDLKPDNIFLEAGTDGSSCIKILDFGIAKVHESTHENAHTNGGTAALGTPFYMPPEQMTPDANVTPAADVWALGLIAFRCLSGRMFWRAAASLQPSALMVVNEVTNLPMPTASQRAAELGGAPIPASFDAWFARAVHRQAGARFVNAEEAYLALCAVFGQVGSITAPLEQPALTGSVGAANTNQPDYRADAFMPTAGITPSAGTATNPSPPPTTPAFGTSEPARPAGRSGVMRAVSIGAALAAGCLGLFLFLALKKADRTDRSYADREAGGATAKPPGASKRLRSSAADPVSIGTVTEDQLKRTDEEIARLKSALASERSEAQRQKLQLALEQEQRRADGLRKRPEQPQPPVQSSAQCACSAADPLCECASK